MTKDAENLRVLHVISGLGAGGAEGVLMRLISHTCPRRHVVVSLTDEGVWGEKLRQLGCEVHCLHMRRSGINVDSMIELVKVIRHRRPEVVQTWMYHADLLGGVAARLAGRRAICWGIRHSRIDRNAVRKSTRLIAALCARLSYYVPKVVVSCSEVAAHDHISGGYDPRKMIVVANGFDLATFRPDHEKKAEQRKAWGVASDEVLLGMVARWHAHKDHTTLCAALQRCESMTTQKWRMVLVGPGMHSANDDLCYLIKAFGLGQRMILGGATKDVPSVMNALDIHVLSSTSEAFPNVVAEAMACGTPVVVTAVGDAAEIVSDTGWVVPAGSADQLATALVAAMTATSDSEGWSRRRDASRRRIQHRYDLEEMRRGFERAWAIAIRESAV